LEALAEICAKLVNVGDCEPLWQPAIAQELEIIGATSAENFALIVEQSTFVPPPPPELPPEVLLFLEQELKKTMALLATIIKTILFMANLFFGV
jgi:hypothetical protein